MMLKQDAVEKVAEDKRYDIDQLKVGQCKPNEINPDKRKLVHNGKVNKGRAYTVNSVALGNVDKYRYLQVQVHRSL